MAKVAIDFKINNTHNNTGQLLIFIYLFITSHPSLFIAAFLIRCLSAVPFLANVLSFSQITTLPACPLVYSFFFFFAYFAGVISEIELLWRKSAPEHWGHMCAVAAAAVSRLALLAAPSLYPVVCQAEKQGKRWDKWLFMICHLLSSQLSPGPIHYCCRQPLCATKHTRTHTNAKQHVCALSTLGFYLQANTHTHGPFPICNSFSLKAAYCISSTV